MGQSDKEMKDVITTIWQFSWSETYEQSVYYLKLEIWIN